MARLRGSRQPWSWSSLRRGTRPASAIPTLTRARLWLRVNWWKNIVSGMMRWTRAGFSTPCRRPQRNYGSEGIAATALSAVDIALWDLKAKLLGQPLAKLLGICRDSAPVYGSGGFTSYDDNQLRAQLGGWVKEGIPRVKMKIGTNPQEDPHRVASAREAIGDATELFVDANGAYSRKQALYFAQLFAEKQSVKWFEEPVSSDDLEGLRLLRDRAPAGMDIAAGEYGWNALYLHRMMNFGRSRCDPG